MAKRFARAVAASVGLDASHVLREGARGTISAVFERSFYASFGDDWICFGGGSIGNGPLNVVLREQDFARRFDSAATGDDIEVNGGGDAERDTWRIRLEGAAVWRPPAGRAWSPLRTRERLEALPRMLPAGVPDEGCACFLHPSPWPRSLAARAAAAPVDAIAGWAAAPCDGTDAPFDAVRALIGLGPGLTPSGDDFLAGCLAALRVVGRDSKAEALWRTVELQAPGRTNPISLSHLRAAGRGRLCESLHRVLALLLSEGPGDEWLGLDCWPDLGHSSPWDALAGVVTTLRASITDGQRGNRAHDD